MRIDRITPGPQGSSLLWRDGLVVGALWGDELTPIEDNAEDNAEPDVRRSRALGLESSRQDSSPTMTLGRDDQYGAAQPQPSESQQNGHTPAESVWEPQENQQRDLPGPRGPQRRPTDQSNVQVHAPPYINGTNDYAPSLSNARE